MLVWAEYLQCCAMPASAILVRPSLLVGRPAFSFTVVVSSLGAPSQRQHLIPLRPGIAILHRVSTLQYMNGTVLYIFLSQEENVMHRLYRVIPQYVPYLQEASSTVCTPSASCRYSTVSAAASGHLDRPGGPILFLLQ